MALSFYPRLKHSTKVSERHAMLIFEKIPGGKFRKIFLKGGMEYGAHSLHDCWYHYRNCFRTTGIPKGMSLVRCESINLIRTADLICFWSCPIRERMRYIRKDM